MITAHSGCEGTPDNSMESIQKSIELGADCAEIDIYMDAQGALWLTHDELEDYSNAVALEDALRVIAESKIAVNCDIKKENLLYPVLEAAEAAGISRKDLIFSGSVDVDILKKDPRIVGRARIFLNFEQICLYMTGKKLQSYEEAAAFFDAHVEEIAALVKELGVEYINPSFRLMIPERIDLAHAHGIALSLWTVNEETEQRSLMQKNLVNMTTRNVSGALRVRRECFYAI